MRNNEQSPEDLRGMSVPDAKEYIAQHISTLKLTEKKVQELDEELKKWNSRIALAHSRGIEDLEQTAHNEANRIKAQQEALGAEIAHLKSLIETMRTQLPGLAARERTIDPDLLEQELLIAAGYLPGEEEKAQEERRFKVMEQDVFADTALAALKAKMGFHGDSQ